ncbi:MULTISPECIES: NUDIX hydrolase [unclassified Actinoplanes]|uniref:NUDIX domain-containing protein n=1 Tax=unclassified Actinoplanes TaxID=2626549 RepID=UPI0003004A28|nr:MULTISPECIES: NUDIX hydrolase [unclassified Actinoplanes]
MTSPNEPPDVSRPQVAAGVLFFDEAGCVLLVQPSYKTGWEIPGGYVEAGESPKAACIREVAEELGLSPAIGDHLIVDWAPATGEGDKLLFIFDGGILPERDRARIDFVDGELADWRFVAITDLETYVPARLARRITTAAAARQGARPVYAEHGVAK